ncbi:MAG: metallophosphoesterase [Chitinophagaceae bacterium]|nr:metallophosphoesterase [Chitinophagaceae bacterium]
MKKIALLSVFLILIQFSAEAQGDTISQRIVLIGDAGQLTDGRHPVVDAVRNLIPLDKKTTILFLGDNIYKNGLPDNQSGNYVQARAVLDSQLSVADGTPSKVFMIPGNHDWENGKRTGFDAIIREQVYVDYLGKPNVKFFPEDGCPGPVEVTIGNDITLILFDSQWWIHPFDKPELESDCGAKTKAELVNQIGEIAARNSKKLVILACHHPFKSNGIHGGFFTLKQHIFPFTDIKKSAYIPLPIIGSIYPIARSIFGTPQDIKHPNYTNMITEVSEAVKAAPNVLFVSGHEHNLQHIRDSSYNYIVSGGGCKQSRTSKSKRALFDSPSFGFGVLEISKNKNVTLTFYTVLDSVRKAYSTTLLNFSKIPEVVLDTAIREVDVPYVRYKDTITISASDKFPVLKGLNTLFRDKSYRPEWSVPVNMKIFKMTSTHGGFVPTSLGGGEQTRTLHLKDSKGKEWVLRTVEKDLHHTIPDNFQGVLPDKIIEQYGPASHPYAPMAIPMMAEALNITTAHPELFFVPNDPAFGFYRPLFANKVCMLEERYPSPDNTDTKSTAKVFGKLLEENDHQADEHVVLRARLLDMLVGDYERHFAQWRWGTVDTGKGKIYYPIPKDRDQAFFYSDGKLLKFITTRAMPFLKGFMNRMPDVDWLNYSARDFDRVFMAEMDAVDWKKAIAQVQESLTDTLFRKAIAQMPPETVALDGETLFNKLVKRRNLLTQEGMNYYRFISKKVNVIGSNQKEYFKLSTTNEGLQVRVYARSKRNDTSFLMYNRIFHPSVTKEIRLFGLNDDDIFEIDSTVRSVIKIRVIGGKGNDTFNIRGRSEALLYDLKSEGNWIKPGSHAKNRFSADPPVNDNTILGFNYNKTSFPQTIFGYNSDDGFLWGAGISRKTYGFRNLPYASDQRFRFLAAPDRKGVQLNYSGEFNHIPRNLNVLIKGYYASPVLRNFYGLGNQTVPDATKRFGFYQTRYKMLNMEALFRHRYFEKMQLMIGPVYQQYSAKYADNIGKVLERPAQIGLDSANIYSHKSYLGLKAAMHFDNRNSELFPSRGIVWHNEVLSQFGLKSGSKYFSRISSDMTVYASINDPQRVIAVMRVGVAKILSKNYEFFQAVSPGGEEYLHGFRKNRYLGKTSTYASMELRIRLFNIKSYIIPGNVGLITFYDVAHVTVKGAESKDLHTAYGVGFYVMPYKLFLISGTFGFSGKERVRNFTIGTKINLTY